MSDVGGAAHDGGGLDITGLRRSLAAGAPTVSGHPGTESITNAELLALDVDVLVPAALEGVLTEENAHTVRAALVVEGANGPTTPGADRVLSDLGTIVVPDILANAGGVVVSYLEWVKNLQAYSWSAADVDLRLRDLMDSAFTSVSELARDRALTLRQAAHAIGVGRVAEAVRARGLYP